MSHIAQLIELLDFLTSPRPEIRRIALANLLPYTTNDSKERSLFLRDQHLENVAKLCFDTDLIAHDALSALINLTNSGPVALRVSKVEGFLARLVRMIINESALLADLGSMLLSNLTKVDSIAIDLLKLRIPFSAPTPKSIEGETVEEPVAKKPKQDDEEIEALDLLLEVFLKGEGKKYNPNADYDFLASVFANVSTLPPGRAFLLATPDPSQEPPLVKLISFTEHPSPIRRGGVASSIKNSTFSKGDHIRLVASTNGAPPNAGSIDLLPQMLLPLCGPEEFDLDVMDTLPEEIQLLPAEKVREPDPAIRTILVETLVLLASGTRAVREYMRSRGVYEVIKAAHLAETNGECTKPMIQLVDLLMREEGPETAIEEVDTTDDITRGSQEISKPMLVDASGKQAQAAAPEFVPAYVQTPAPQVDSEDEEEMLLEV